MAKKLDYTYCQAAPVIEWFGNKWVMVVLLKLEELEIARFNELYRCIPSLSEKVLASTLDLLEQDGLVERRLYADVPPRTEYRITEFGATLLPHLHAMIDWGKANFATIQANRSKVIKK